MDIELLKDFQKVPLYLYYFLSYYGIEKYKMIKKIMKNRYNKDLDSCLEYGWNYLSNIFNNDIIHIEYSKYCVVLFYNYYEHNGHYIFNNYEQDKEYIEHILDYFKMLYHYEYIGDYIYLVRSDKMYKRIYRINKLKNKLKNNIKQNGK